VSGACANCWGARARVRRLHATCGYVGIIAIAVISIWYVYMTYTYYIYDLQIATRPLALAPFPLANLWFQLGAIAASS